MMKAVSFLERFGFSLAGCSAYFDVTPCRVRNGSTTNLLDLG
jgi:hypothetical protein